MVQPQRGTFVHQPPFLFDLRLQTVLVVWEEGALEVVDLLKDILDDLTVVIGRVKSILHVLKFVDEEDLTRVPNENLSNSILEREKQFTCRPKSLSTNLLEDRENVVHFHLRRDTV